MQYDFPPIRWGNCWGHASLPLFALFFVTGLMPVLGGGVCASGAETPEVLYSESFDQAPDYVGAKGPNDNNISFVAIGVPGSKFPHVRAGQFAGTMQYQSDVAIPSSVNNGKLVIGSDKPVYDKSRNRTTITVIDSSAATVGQYNVSFDVSDFQSGDNDTALYLHLYEGNSLDAGRLEAQLTAQELLPKLVENTPKLRGIGGKIDRILLDNEITGNGRYSLNFGIRDAGKKGDFLMLAWSQVKRGGASPMPSLSIDNVVVSKLPAPAEKGTTRTDIPKSPFGPTGAWKLRESVSDEFNDPSVDTTKWNNHPESYGAMSWDEKQAFQKDGRLHLQLAYAPHTRSNTKLFYKSGVVRSHEQMVYGYYEARIKGCKLFPGACPAFWMFSDGRQYEGKVRYCEIDFVELQMNELNHDTNKRNSVHHIDMNLHLRMMDEEGKLQWHRPDSDPDLCKNSWIAPWDPRDDFHVYGCEVGKQTITWYIDGEKVASRPNLYWHLPMNVALTLELRHPHIGWQGQQIFPVPKAATEEGFPTTMEVDYVRVWSREP